MPQKGRKARVQKNMKRKKKRWCPYHLYFLLRSFQTTCHLRWSATLLCFIPKKENPKQVSDYRPISLCNVSYRMRTWLPNRISNEQCAFLKNRRIHDNIMLVQELAHSMSAYKRNKSIILIKIDIEKAQGKMASCPQGAWMHGFSSSLDTMGTCLHLISMVCLYHQWRARQLV